MLHLMVILPANWIKLDLEVWKMLSLVVWGLASTLNSKTYFFITKICGRKYANFIKFWVTFVCTTELWIFLKVWRCSVTNIYFRLLFAKCWPNSHVTHQLFQQNMISNISLRIFVWILVSFEPSTLDEKLHSELKNVFFNYFAVGD